MIEMNLVDSQAYIIGNYSMTPARKNAAIALLAIVLISIPTLSFFGARTAAKIYSNPTEENIQTIREIASYLKLDSLAEVYINAHPPKVEEEEAQEIAKEVKIRNPADDRVLEEIIDNVDTKTELTASDQKYDDMSKWEQINYEVKFNAMLLEAFTRFAPQTMAFNTIEISDYKLLTAEGTAPDRQTISSLLSKFKKGEWELLPKPNTNVRDGGSFYYFRVEVEYYPTMKDVIRLPKDPKNVPMHSRLGEAKESVVKTARAAGLRTQGLVLENSIYEPDVKEYTYSLKLNGSYGNTLLFIKNLADMDIPVRNSKVSIKNKEKSVECVVTLTINVQ